MLEEHRAVDAVVLTRNEQRPLALILDAAG
jgi:hypothetical protein